MVKSSGQVIGPYSDIQLVNLLKDREIVPLDEISVPCGRWEYVRDVPAFAKVVEELRTRPLRSISDDTATQSEEVTGATESINTAQIDDLTLELSQPKVQHVQDILFSSIDDQIASQSRLSGELFTHERDQKIKHQVEKSSKWIWTFTTVIIIMAMLFVVFQQFVAKPIKDRTQLEDSVTAGINSLESGDYGRALEHFKLANKLDPNDSSIYLYLGILMIQIDGQAYEGRQFLEKLIEISDKDLKRIYTGIGLGALKDGDYKSAENSFNRALDIDPLFQPALINLGAAAYYQEDWAKANNYFQLAVKEGSGDGAEILMLTQTLIKLWEKERESRYLIEASTYLDQFLRQSRNYSLEAYIGSVYISYLLGQKQNIYSAINRVLDMDTLETESHRQNLFIHRSLANWTLVSQWCLKLTHDLDPNSRVIAFEALCIMKTNDLAEANKKIEDALAQTPKDPLVLSVYALLLGEMSAGDRAIVAIDKALVNDQEKNYSHPLRLKARHCRQMDNVECQYQYWSEVLIREPSSLSALAGLAQVSLGANQLEEAKKYLMRGLNVSKEYRPFFPINRVISKVEDRAKAKGL